jgi:hypothetical protein
MAAQVIGRDYYVCTKPVLVVLRRPVPHYHIDRIELPIARSFVIVDSSDTTDLYPEPAVDLPPGLIHDAVL